MNTFEMRGPIANLKSDHPFQSGATIRRSQASSHELYVAGLKGTPLQVAEAQLGHSHMPKSSEVNAHPRVVRRAMM